MGLKESVTCTIKELTVNSGTYNPAHNILELYRVLVQL